MQSFAHSINTSALISAITIPEDTPTINISLTYLTFEIDYFRT